MDAEVDLEILEFRTPDGAAWRLVGWKNVIKWIEELAIFWDWLPSYRGRDPANVVGHTGQRYQDLIIEATGLRSRKVPPAQLGPVINNLMSDGYTPVHPKSDRGRVLAQIRRVAGDEAAVFAFSLLGGVVNANQAHSGLELRGATLALSPEILALADDTAKLQAERAAFRRAVQAFDEESEKVALNRDRAWDRMLVNTAGRARHWHKRRARRWIRYAKTAREAESGAIESIKSVETAYREHMGLKAPVEYWSNKAKQHKNSEFWARTWVLAFFVITLPAMASAFAWTGWVLIDQALQVRPKGAPPFPTAIFIIASAGLASCAGLVFWAGRLLTKLYLSQHHLRQDAEERATMTETYLALIENSAASTEDRQVILNALFRNTPDGIVKEEGGMDPSLAAALGKFLSR